MVGIDIIIAAGSTGIWAPDPLGPYNKLREGDEPIRGQPFLKQDAAGDPTIIATTEGFYRYVGHFLISFDEKGVIESYDGRSGILATSKTIVDELGDTLKIRLEPMEEVATLFREYRKTNVIQEAFYLVGRTEYLLNGNREDVRTRETNMGRLVADSTLWGGNFYAQDNNLPPVDIALKNGGGIRAPIFGPSIVQLTVESALAFDNKLSIVRLNAGQLIAAMENAVSRAPSADGRFPHVAGMTLVADLSKPGIEGTTENTFQNQPSRIRSLVVATYNGTVDTVVSDFTAMGDLERTFVMATNSFLLTGGDAYFALTDGIQLAETEIGEQYIFVNYIAEALLSTVEIPDPPPDTRVMLESVGDEGSDITTRT